MPSGAAPTRVSIRRGKQRMELGPYLSPIPRPGAVRLWKRNTSGVHAKVASAADAPVQVCAAAWHNGHAGRAVSRVRDSVKTLRAKPASAGGATAAENQKIQDLNIVVVGLLKNDKLLKQVMKAMCQRNGKLTEDLQKLQAELDAMK